MRRLFQFAQRSAAISLVIVVFLGAFLGLAGCHAGAKQDVEPKILFTQVPQWNLGDQNQQDVMEGTVSGARQGQRLVIYSKIGGLWWLQLSLASPFTAIQPDNAWRNEAHLGTDYAALLVDPSYRPAAFLERVPERGDAVAAVAVSHGPEKSSSYFVDFSGFRWRVRWKPSDRGGANNQYNPENVFLDKAGALHLQIVQRGQQWTCSEVNLTRSLGYGTYSFTVEDISSLEPNVVFGIFTWDYSTEQENHAEFDIEISRWGEPENKNAEFVLQPTFVPTNISRFDAPAGKLKHTIVWEPGRVTMMTSRASAGPRDPVISKHVYTSEVPKPGSESLRMTLYVYWNVRNKEPGLQHRAEVVVDQFQYLP